MGYACPVCDLPQADGEHLANHLAFTAMLHDDEHADFLDANLDDWQDRTPPELAAELIHLADWTEYDEVFEDTTEGPGMGHAGPGGVESGPTVGGESAPRTPDPDDPLDLDAAGDETLDDETRRVVEEARRLFERTGEPDEED